MPFVGSGDPLGSECHWAWPSERHPGVSWHCLSTAPRKSCSADTVLTASPVCPGPTIWGGKSRRMRKGWKDVLMSCYQQWQMCAWVMWLYLLLIWVWMRRQRSHSWFTSSEYLAKSTSHLWKDEEIWPFECTALARSDSIDVSRSCFSSSSFFICYNSHTQS